MKRMRKRKWIEPLKTALIVILALIAVLLGRETGVVPAARSALSSAASPAEESGVSGETLQNLRSARAAEPEALCVCQPSGRTGIMWDESALNAAFERFSAALAEAIGTAAASGEETEAELLTALQNYGVFFSYRTALPPETLALWLGTSPGAGMLRDDISMLFLSAGERAVTLHCRTDSGMLYRCETAVQPETLRARMEDYQPNGARFAIEDPRLAALSPDFMLLSELPAMPPASVSAVPVSALDCNRLARLFGMNSYVMTGYSESDGTAVYIDGELTLRVSPDAVMQFRRTGAVNAADADPGADAAKAWAFASGALSGLCGDAAFSYAGKTETASGTVFRFEYALNGIRVSAPAAAEITVSGGNVVYAVCRPLAFSLSEGTETLLPLYQAAAIASAGGASRPAPFYAETEDGLHCLWIYD